MAASDTERTSGCTVCSRFVRTLGPITFGLLTSPPRSNINPYPKKGSS